MVNFDRNDFRLRPLCTQLYSDFLRPWGNLRHLVEGSIGGNCYIFLRDHDCDHHHRANFQPEETDTGGDERYRIHQAHHRR